MDGMAQIEGRALHLFRSVMGQPKLILMFVGKPAPVLELAKMLSRLLLTLILLAYMLVDQPPRGSGTASAKDSVIW